PTLLYFPVYIERASSFDGTPFSYNVEWKMLGRVPSFDFDDFRERQDPATKNEKSSAGNRSLFVHRCQYNTGFK
ncbi:MAG: hypothetical protein Q9169_008225, partial [Polycauliona sp. 2 TL-2023]